MYGRAIIFLSAFQDIAQKDFIDQKKLQNTIFKRSKIAKNINMKK